MNLLTYAVAAIFVLFVAGVVTLIGMAIGAPLVGSIGAGLILGAGYLIWDMRKP